MTERSVVTKFEAKVDGYLAGVAKMQAATAGFAKQGEKSLTKHKADWDKISKAALVGGAVIGAAVVGAAKAYMDFEKEMSGVAAVADATKKQQDQLADSAIKAGQATVFSASEAAKAEAELAKAGVGVNDILQGGLIGSINLAAAGQIDLAKSAEISAQAMNIFGLEGKDVGHIADVLTAGANKSAAGVDDLGLALQQGGLVAKQTGLSLEDTVGTLSAFADNALKGSDAGTSLKTMLQRLNPQSAEAADLMDQLGLRAYDSQGNFVGLAEYAGKLQKALSGMSQEQRNAALQTLFGSDAVRGANVLYEQGEAGIRKYVAAVDDQGAAARMAGRQMDNLAGDVEQLKGSLETAFIEGGKGNNGALRGLVQDLTAIVNKFGELSPETQATIVKVAALTAGVLLLSGASIKATTSILSLKASMDAAGISATRLSTALGLIGKGTVLFAVAAVAHELAQMAPNAKAAQVPVADLADSLERIAQGQKDAGKFGDLFQESGIFAKDIRTAADAMDAFATSAQIGLGQNFGDRLERWLGGSGGQKFSDQVDQIDQSLARLVQSGHAEEARKQYDDLIAAITKANEAGAGIPVDEVKAKFEQYQAALDSTAVSSANASNWTDDLKTSVRGASKVAQDAAESAKSFADAVSQLNQPALDARSAARAVEQAIHDAGKAADGTSKKLIENGKALSLHTEKGRQNQAALDAVAQAMNDQIGVMQRRKASDVELGRQLHTSRERLYEVARQFGKTKGEARAYIDEVLKIPPTANTKATFTTVGYSQLKAAGDYLKGLKDKHVTLTVGTVRVGNTTVNAGQYAGGGAAIGPGTATSDSIPAKLSNGEHVWTAEEVTKAGGQGAMYRARSLVRAGALKFRDGGAVGYADGGEVDWSAILDILGDVTVWSDVAQARGTAKSRAAAVRSAQAAVRAARGAVSAARRTTGHRDDAIAADKLAAAQLRLSAAMTKSAAATKAANQALSEYRADRRPLIDRTLSASASSNGTTKAFLDNVDRLIQMGFKTLALYLLDQGGPEAATLAAQAVKSAAKAKTLQSRLSASASLADREAAIRAALTGTSLSGVTPELGWYSQVRDLAPSAQASAIAAGAGAAQVTINIDGALDPVETGAKVEQLLQRYTSVTGRPVQIQVAKAGG